MALLCECSRTTQVALRGRFIQTLTEKSIAIQNMTVHVYIRDAKDDNGSKELVDLRNRNTFLGRAMGEGHVGQCLLLEYI